jgi:UDP-GlcNAc3NAcA epimerase
MIKLVTIIGARPQIIKAAALSRAIHNHFSQQIEEVIVHTGQHYDENMSEVFIRQLGIPQPTYNLNVGSGSHGKQTAKMLEGIEEILVNEKPDYIVLYGDTNSTLAGAIAAAKIHTPIVHIEAGLRSFNKAMPEEINRIMCDHSSTLLFSPTTTGYNNLVREGFNPTNQSPFTTDNPGIFHCGDIMYDNSLFFGEVASMSSTVLQDNSLFNKSFILCTIHRNNNTDKPDRLNSIFNALLEIARISQQEVLIPLHPRTSKMLQTTLSAATYQKVINDPLIKIIEPVSFLDMIQLEKNTSLVVTDSGGVQKEAFFFGKRCLILRPETEWKELVDCGAAVICDADYQKIVDSFLQFSAIKNWDYPQIFGDGHAAQFICQQILHNTRLLVS